MVDRISVRMYDVGFGDCFLLRFWTGSEVKRVLIDCGSITEGKAQVDKVVKDVIATCSEDGHARIDLVVATHRHKDHVGGFASAAWADVEVGAVWMPWTEDPHDERATYVRNRQSSLAAALTAGLDGEAELLAARAPRRESAAAADLRAQRAMALNALTNEKAMATLHGGFAAQVPRTFLPLKETVCEARSIPGVAGVTVHVLGPPRDEKAMSIMDPPQGAGYLTAPGQAGRPATVFSDKWAVDEANWRLGATGTTFSPEDMAALMAMAEQPAGELAAALDNALNNTSLILVFEVAGQVMLFPADAQWGAWDAAMKEPKARALLERATFYKVGHHGSHNATPKALIEELMPAGFTALFSTCHVKQWPNIPRAPLVEAIRVKAGRYARSDDEAQATAAGLIVEAGLYMELDLPAL